MKKKVQGKRRIFYTWCFKKSNPSKSLKPNKYSGTSFETEKKLKLKKNFHL